VQNSAEGSGSGFETPDHGRAGAAAAQLLQRNAHNNAEFLAYFGHEHSVDFSSGRAYNDGGKCHTRV
jgi:hypothetical protein